MPPGPPRYMPSGTMHTIVIVEMPSLVDVMKALEEDALPPNEDVTDNGQHPPITTSDTPSDGTQPHHGNGAGVSPQAITGRSLPLLFIRASDGVGYHSGRTIACENVFQTMELDMATNPANPPGPVGPTGWLAAAHVDSGLHGWTLRVM
jgi:recombining binding protein (suppressor of hairless)